MEKGKIELKKLSINDGKDVYDMLQKMPEDENGFMNGASGLSYEAYEKWLVRENEIAEGVGLESWMVPQTCYWLYIDGKPAGFGKIRHALTESLLVEGGNVGYAVLEEYRGKGYGTAFLGELVMKSKELGVKEILLTINSYNTASIKMGLANGGVVEKEENDKTYVWIR